MNKKLDESLQNIFLSWRLAMTDVEDMFLAGKLTYPEYLSKLKDTQEAAATEMFVAVHQHCEW